MRYVKIIQINDANRGKACVKTEGNQMLLALSNKISEIDRYCADNLGLSLYTLMGRSGEAVASAVSDMLAPESRIVILAGKGNNGGDGYAAACLLFDRYDVTVYDVFSSGQRSEEGRAYLEKFKNMGGRIENFEPNDKSITEIKTADCIIDAVFGTGYRGDPPEVLRILCRTVNESVRPLKIAIDVPMGINADNGSVDTTSAVTVSATVALSMIKPGLVSFPAKAYVGRLIYTDLGIPGEKIRENFSFSYHLVDRPLAAKLLPDRAENTSKGSFGRLLLLTGSDKYRGAAALSLSAALRGGAGYTVYMGTETLVSHLSQIYPEAIYESIPGIETITDPDIERIVAESKKATVTLIGSGSYASEGLYRLVKALLESDGGTLVLDADAINVLADKKEEGRALLSRSERTVILTPHPLEFARLSGNTVSDVQLHRIEAALKFAAEHRVILALKGAATVVTDGVTVYINSSGSSALSKAGSGDVLAGFVSSLVASGADPLTGTALSVFLHGSAADALSTELSAFSVTPSDLPLEIGRQISILEKHNKR